MALHGDLAADGDEILDGGGACDADLGHDHAMAADHHVVGDLDQVVDLGALADHRVAARAPVHGGVGADLHVVLDDHAPDLRHLQMALRTHGEAEPVLPDAHARMEDDPVADEGVGHGHVGAMEQSRPILTCGPMTECAPIRVPAPISASGPITAPGSTRTPCSSRAAG